MIYFSTICVLTGSYDDGISHNINIYYGINNWKASSVGNASEKHQTTKISDPSIQVSSEPQNETSYATSTKEQEVYIHKATLISPSPMIPLSTTQHIDSGNSRLS